MPLESLPSITALSSRVTRILGGNPGPFTLQGTNTYLIGTKSLALIDTGEGKDCYIADLRKALQDKPHSKLEKIFLSHWHLDHTKGLPSVLQLLAELQHPPPKIYKAKSTRPNEDSNLEPLWMLLKAIPDVYTPFSRSFIPHELQDNDTFELESNSTVRVIHTPGHTSDSCSFLFTSQDEKVFFTGDTVLGSGSTTVFSNLSLYLSSLQKCIDVITQTEKSMSGAMKLYPAHGEVIESGRKKMEEYIAHREERNRQVLQALSESVEGLNIVQLVEKVYGNALDKKVKLAAAAGLKLHLQALESRNQVEYVPSLNGTEVWQVIEGNQGRL